LVRLAYRFTRERYPRNILFGSSFQNECLQCASGFIGVT
jgi:hypothetical protein